MQFYSDPSFFMLSACVVAGAAFLGLREHSLKRYGFCASLFFLACLFCKDAYGAACLAVFLCAACAGFRWLAAHPASRVRFRIALAAALAPLLVYKISCAGGCGIMGFMGISYITFRAVQVLIETHDGLIENMGMFDYLYFLLFFPSFPTGPIDRSRRFEEDLNRVLSRDAYAGLLARGILLVLAGALYSFVFAQLAHTGYAPVAWGSGAWYAELLKQLGCAFWYGLYLFFDFAGSCLMAMGLGYCLGVRLPRNFRAPFCALDIKDFWNRWNMTLSFWLRDFVFMRFSRFAIRRKLFKKRLHTAQAGFMVNMLLMGAWHGLTCDYLLYGLYHGLLLAATEGFQKTHFYKSHRKKRWFKLASWCCTMVAVFFGFALFSGQVTMLVKGALHV